MRWLMLVALSVITAGLFYALPYFILIGEGFAGIFGLLLAGGIGIGAFFALLLPQWRKMYYRFFKKAA